MPASTWLFVWLGIVALTRAIRSHSAASVDSSRSNAPRARWRRVTRRAPVPSASVSCYLRDGFAYIPTFGREAEGLRRMIEPVAVVPVTDAAALHLAIREAMLRGEPSLPSLDPRGRKSALPPLPRLSGAGSWSAFYAGVKIWQIDRQDGSYRIAPKLLEAANNRWVVDGANTIVLPPNTGLDGLCDRAVEILAVESSPPRRSPFVNCYLRRGIVYVPTHAQLPGGIHLMVEPIAAVPLENTDKLRAVVQERLIQGNPMLGIEPPRHHKNEHALLTLAGAESWSAFGRSSTGLWEISDRDDGPKITPHLLYSKKGSWRPDEGAAIPLPAGTPLDAACDRLIEMMRAAVPAASGILQPRIPSAVETLQANPEAEPYVALPPSPDRVDELADFLEWIANAEPEDAPVIRGEIKRYYYDHGDVEGGDALNHALEEALVATDRLERAKILDRFERYVQEDWVTENWRAGA